MKRRIQKLLILLIAAALMACCTPGCGTVTPTPTPTGTPDSTPTPATTPSPTPDDTVVPPATDAPVTTPEPTPSQSPALTETERMAEIEAFLSQEPQNLFLQAVYDDVSQLPLHIALRQYSDRFIPYEEAENILLDAGYEVVADISYFNSEGLDNILRRMTGYGLADKDWNNTLVYVAEADMYSSQHSDTWLQRVICTDVEVSGDLYTVTYKGNLKFYYFDENTKLHKAYQMVVTLRKSENGEYHFVSNHPVLTDDAKLAEIEAFLNTAPQNNFIQNIYSDISELPFSTMTYNYHCDDDSAAYGRSVFGIPEDTAVCCFDYRDLDDLLRRFTGYGKSEHNWTDDLNTYYSPGFNIYCRELAAPIDQTVSCISITTDGDICTVTYTTQSGEPFRYRSRGGQPFSSGQMAVTLRDLGNGEYHFISNLALTEPQLTESEHLAEIEHFLNQQPQNLFIRAVYDDISQLPLDVALREYCDFCIPYEDAQQVLLDAGYELYTDISYFNSEGLDSILRRMTGYGLDDIQWKNSTVYVEDAASISSSTETRTTILLNAHPSKSTVTCIRSPTAAHPMAPGPTTMNS